MIRVYADTSVFGSVFDDEFQDTSIAFFALVRKGHFKLTTSSVVLSEIERAPEKIRQFFLENLTRAELIEVTEDALQPKTHYNLDKPILMLV